MSNEPGDHLWVWLLLFCLQETLKQKINSTALWKYSVSPLGPWVNFFFVCFVQVEFKYLGVMVGWIDEEEPHLQ